MGRPDTFRSAATASPRSVNDTAPRAARDQALRLRDQRRALVPKISSTITPMVTATTRNGVDLPNSSPDQNGPAKRTRKPRKKSGGKNSRNALCAPALRAARKPGSEVMC